jgi:hypothetical protein
MRIPSSRPLSLAVLSLALPLATSPARAADQAGVSAAVRGDVALTRVAVVGHQVVSGESIFLQDAIKSGTRSGMQILLLDQTVFTIGPESELVIDEFVYDPKTNAGKLGAEITKGVFRFVSGKIAHEKPDDMTVKLPAGTLGVRGTMVAGRVDEVKKSSRLVLLGEGAENDLKAPAGAFVACNAGVCVQVSRPGYGTVIEGPGAPPVKPFLFPRAEIDSITGAVSDPEGWLETAKAHATAPPVGSGPNGSGGNGSGGTSDNGSGGGDSGGDTRSATEISGIRTAAGTQSSQTTLARLRTLDGLDQASDSASQYSTQSVSVNGQTVELPTSCSDVSSCIPGLTTPSSGVSGATTTFDQLSTLASSGLQQASYQRAGLPLINTNGQADGSYDFSLLISLGNRSANLSFSNINSSLLSIAGASFGQATDYSSYPLGVGLPVVFAATSTLTARGPCANGCQAAGTAELINANGRIGDSAVQAMAITTPTTPGAPVVGTVSATAQAIPRP